MSPRTVAPGCERKNSSKPELASRSCSRSVSSRRCGGSLSQSALRRSPSTLLLRKNFMKIKQLILSSVVAFAGLAVLTPSIASAAQHREYKARHAHKVCKWNAHGHQRVCRWVR